MAEPANDVSIAELMGPSDHLDLIASWLNEEWGQEDGYTLDETRRWCAEVAASETEAVFAAFAGETVAGTALLVGCDLDLQRHLRPWLSGFYISPGFRGQGIGAHMLRAVEAAAAKQSYERIYLYCRAGRLIANYEAHGWRMIEHFELHGKRYSLMAKPL